jgi:predicted nuclease of predicted toxin-antitoxin system
MIRFYFDEHMPRSVAKGVVRQGIPVTMAVDVEMTGKDDDTEHLPYATENELVLVTFDRPFAGRTMSQPNPDHNGLICLSEKLRQNIGGAVKILIEFAEQHTPEDCEGRVFWLK